MKFGSAPVSGALSFCPDRVAMSALGQKQTCATQKVMSALHPIADMCSATRDVRFVPIADIALFDDLIGAGRAATAEQRHENGCGESQHRFINQ